MALKVTTCTQAPEWFYKFYPFIDISKPVDIRLFGVAKDGVTDDTAAIQAAVKATEGL